MPGRSNGELLVLNGITREDQGMYQCIARRAEGDTAQASAELQLGGYNLLSITLFALCIK